MLRNVFVQSFAWRFEFEVLALPWARKISRERGADLQMGHAFLPRISAAGAGSPSRQTLSDGVCVSIYFFKSHDRQQVYKLLIISENVIFLFYYHQLS